MGAISFGGTGRLAPSDLAGFPLIQQATRPRLWADLFAAAGLGAVERLRGPRSEHFDMVIAAARAGLGLALLPEIFVRKDIEAGTLRQVVDIDLTGSSPYALIYSSARTMSVSLRSFADWLRKGA